MRQQESNHHHNPLQLRIPTLRRRSVKRILYFGATCVAGLLYLHAFFYYQPDRSQARLDAWQASIEQAKEEKRLIAEDQKSRVALESTGDTTAVAITDTQPQSTATEEGDTTSKQRSSLANLLDWLFFWMLFSFIFRMYLKHCIYPRLTRARAQRAHQDLRERRQRFRQWVTRLNRQREYNGQRPLSMGSLSLVLRDRDLLDGEDYDGLLQFDEEAGPAMEALLNSVGATTEEIERCPLRVLQPNDDLLIRRRDPTQGGNRDGEREGNACPICLEAFEVNDTVRTIPCFHSFHKDCIDPWLSQRALCPVCKYNAIG